MVKIDQNKCIGCGMCALTCPKVFEIKDGKAHVKSEANIEENKEKIKEMIDSCPVDAISK